MDKHNGYEGKIKNSGAQTVEAPFRHDKPDNTKIVEGKDLRAGK